MTDPCSTVRTVPPVPLPWYARLLLRDAAQVELALERIRAAGVVDPVPNSWQVFLGVLRMWNRVMFHSGPIGTSACVPVRRGWRARLLRWRPLRFPFLLRERAVVPLDLSGLATPPRVLRAHLLGAYHAEDGAIYDLRLLSCSPGELEALRDELAALLGGARPARLEWLRDLCVYEGYHEQLLASVERALAGDWSASPGPEHTDTTLEDYLRWCASRPGTPGETWRAARSGRLGLNQPAPAVEVAA